MAERRSSSHGTTVAKQEHLNHKSDQNNEGEFCIIIPWRKDVRVEKAHDLGHVSKDVDTEFELANIKWSTWRESVGSLGYVDTRMNMVLDG